MAGEVRVTGLTELNRAFKKMSGGLDKELRGALIEAASPVKVLAQQFSIGHIANMPRSPEWAEMRTGVDGKATVYIRPRRRNRGGSGRPNLKGLLQREMNAAKDQKQEEVVKGVEQMIDDLAGANGF